MENPYASSPAGNNPAPGSSDPGISQQAIQALAGTKPWVRLCSVIGFIGSGFMVLGGIFMILGGAVGLSQISESSPLGFAPLALMGFVYLILAFLYIYPSVKLWAYGSRIVELMSSRAEVDLIAALDAQRAFWKFVGIMISIVIGIYIVAAVIGVIVLIFGAAAASSAASP